MRVLVSGASGNTGGAVLSALRQAGVKTRAMTRSDASAARLRADGHEAVIADLSDPATLAAAVEGVDAIYVATSANPQLAEQEGALAKAAASVGVGRLVKLSAISASADTPLRLARMHWESEQLIREAIPEATVLRPNGFMQNTLAWIQQIPGGVIHSPVVDARWSIVDVADIAAAAASVLTDPEGHSGADYTLTGPEALSPREEVATLAGLLDRPLSVEEVPLDVVPGVLESVGMTAWVAERIVELYGLYAEGRFEAISADVERLTGRPPRSWEQFARDHLGAFAGE